ncbi:MAG: hypothetical protein ACE368_06490 [Paracoccaceae bacterium]
MKEEDIRPKAIFDEYLALAAKDADAFFGSGDRVHIDCPACGAAGVAAFMKSGFAYGECLEFLTLYICNSAVQLKDRFWKTMATYLSDEDRARMQRNLAELGLSSHMMIVAQRRT